MDRFIELFTNWVNLLMCVLHLFVAARYSYAGDIKGILFLWFAIVYGYLQIARMHQQKQHKQELEKLKRLYYSPCINCKYYYGQHGINCAVHPDKKWGEDCIDWVKKKS